MSSYTQVKAWLDAQGVLATCTATVEQLKALEQPLYTAQTVAEDKHKVQLSAREQIEALARAAGLTVDIKVPVEPAKRGRKPKTPVDERESAKPRKPNLIPDDEHTDCYAKLVGDDPSQWPAPFKEFLAREKKRSPNAQWSREDFNWKKIAAARKRNGLPADKPWNPKAKIEQLYDALEREGKLNPKR